jgi:hypothetical protein
MALNYAHLGITVTCLCPDVVNTGVLSRNEDDARRNGAAPIPRVPAPRVGESFRGRRATTTAGSRARTDGCGQTRGEQISRNDSRNIRPRNLSNVKLRIDAESCTGHGPC